MKKRILGRENFQILLLILMIGWLLVSSTIAMAAYCNGDVHFFQTGPDSNTNHIEAYEVIMDLSGIMDEFDIISLPHSVFLNEVDVGPLDVDLDGFSDRDFMGIDMNAARWGATRKITQQNCISNQFKTTCGYGVIAIRRKQNLSSGKGIVHAQTRALLTNGQWKTFSITWEPYFHDCTPTQLSTTDDSQDSDNRHLQEKRVALVIGNNAYQDAPLDSPINDARDIANALTSLNFEVMVETDNNQQQMEEAINQFANKIQNGDVALFYFSGHGSQIDGQNYLIPIDENIQSASDIRYKAVNIGYVLGKMEEANNQTNIIILDACRNNPFKGFKSQNQGFAPMLAPRGTFIGYATAPGAVAWVGGNERNSIYTKHLLDVITTKGLLIEQIFKQVIRNVEDDTYGQQIPWVSFSLRGDFYFNR